jgi:hypothetical protein
LLALAHHDRTDPIAPFQLQGAVVMAILRRRDRAVILRSVGSLMIRPQCALLEGKGDGEGIEPTVSRQQASCRSGCVVIARSGGR